MSPRASTLLGLVLCLGQTIHMQPGDLPKPSLRAKPGPVIRLGRPVTFLCWSPAGAQMCRLEKGGRTVRHYQNLVPLDDSQGTEDRFLFPMVTEETAGNYRCFCFTRFSRSELSEPLQLKVAEEDVSTWPAGALPKPSLRAEPGPVVPRGRPVTFVCQGPAGAEIFYLEKDGRRVYLYHKSEPQGGLPVTEARFHIPAVSDVTAGSYRCLYENVYEVRSERSEPLQLQVTEEDASTPTSGGCWGRPLYWEVQRKRPATRPTLKLPPTEVTPLPTEMASGTGPTSRDYTVENSICLGLAGVVLLILVAILVDAGLSQRRSPQGPQE